MEEGIRELPTYIRTAFKLPSQDVRTYSPLTLAFIGDGVYDLIIRTKILAGGNAPVHKLHKRASEIVKAASQASMMHQILEELTEEELSIYKRGRNAKSQTVAKNASVSDYRTATGFEALIGYLYLMDNMTRIIELIQIGFLKLNIE